MTTDKLDIAELKRLKRAMFEAGFARETNTYDIAKSEYEEFVLLHADELIARAERAEVAEEALEKMIRLGDAELRKDALRYRYLRRELSAERKSSMWPENGEVWIIKYIHPAGTHPEVRSAGLGIELDANIDWAISNIPKESGNG